MPLLHVTTTARQYCFIIIIIIIIIMESTYRNGLSSYPEPNAFSYYFTFALE